jgi:hypothetical protein
MAAFLNTKISRAMRPSAAEMKLVEFDPLDAPVLFREKISANAHAHLLALD